MNKKRIKSIIVAVPVVFLLVFLDQWTKQLTVTYLSHKDIDIIPGVLQLHYLRNTGAAFSLLENQMLLFYILTPFLCIIMAYLYVVLPFTKRFLSFRVILIFVFSGAIGNFIDRILYQSVIDFIYVSLIRFPVFNVADIYVTCSVIALFIFILFVYSEEDLTVITDAFKFKKK